MLSDLQKKMEGEVLSSPIECAMYAIDASIYRVEPMAVARPKSAADVDIIMQWAEQNGVSIHGRGSGSGLTGACLGEGLVVDFRRYLNEIVEIKADEKKVRVQPGVVHTDLNRALARYGLFFPPDPASGDYCSLGGMIANNSSGARSVKYGATIDYVLALETVLPTIGSFTAGQVPKGIRNKGSKVGDLLSSLDGLLQKGLPTFQEHLPHAPKNCCGYRLERALLPDGTLDLAKLFVGSEGTLGLVTEATLALAPLPQSRRLALINFGSLEAMSEAVCQILPLNPSAVEVMDRPFLELVRRTREDLRHYIPEGTEAQLLVELDGTKEETEESAARLTEMFKSPKAKATLFIEAESEADQEQLWSVRKAALPLLFTLPGPGRITPFIEDVSVSPDKLADYLAKLHEIFGRHGVESAVYGHAGDGNLHTRPILDLQKKSDIDLMQRLADEVFELVMAMKGSVSGEHGDGRLRTPLLPAFYGEAYTLLEETKLLFDKNGLLNPGIIAGAHETSMTEELERGPEYSRKPLQPPFGGKGPDFAEMVEKCHGCSKCTTPSEVINMCPLYKATGIPEASPRGKMALAQAIIGRHIDIDVQRANELLDKFAYCLGCGLCAKECPSLVETPLVVRQLRAYLRQRTGMPLKDRVLSLLSSPLPKVLQPFAWFASQVNRLKLARLLLSATLDISSDAPLFQFSPFRMAENLNEQTNEAIYFPDTYAALCEPNLGAVCMEMLERAGFTAVTSPALVACAPALARGDVQTAKEVAQTVAKVIPQRLGPRTPLVFSEPTAQKTVEEDYPILLEQSADAKTMAKASISILRLLQERLEDGALPRPRKEASKEESLVYHSPCHLRGSKDEKTAVTLLQRLGYKVDRLPTSCCGLAGTFGLSRKEPGFSVSQKIGKAVFSAIRDSKATIVLSECSACRLQIAQATGVHTLHPIVLVAKLYGEED